MGNTFECQRSRSQKRDQLWIITIYRAHSHIHTNAHSAGLGQLHSAGGKIISAYRTHHVLNIKHISQLRYRRSPQDVTAFAHRLTFPGRSSQQADQSLVEVKLPSKREDSTEKAKVEVIKTCPEWVVKVAVHNSWQTNHALQFLSEVGWVKWQPVGSKFRDVQSPFLSLTYYLTDF